MLLIARVMVRLEAWLTRLSWMRDSLTRSSTIPLLAPEWFDVAKFGSLFLHKIPKATWRRSGLSRHWILYRSITFKSTVTRHAPPYRYRNSVDVTRHSGGYRIGLVFAAIRKTKYGLFLHLSVFQRVSGPVSGSIWVQNL
ncbi:hypothetical protein C8R47DRAFT_1083165 [Mycena vitilis]|nr:hypothetical protein C8R47DRAFT_1083165 [Mycena vitilis]